MDTRFRYAKWIGLLLGLLLGIAIDLVPAVLYRLSGHDSSLAGDIRGLGPRGGFIYGLLGHLVTALILGLFFSVIGFQWGRYLQEAAERRNASRAREATQGAKDAWPPPPIKGDTDDA